ncbi:restriction endonuclease subunit S [Micromonospora ureilytica]|uniref:Type I restriction modification DNA specificity domain-containing protein n=1 Tax=Micromonospora ureilytica TaxID=709868 RepID=A0ABS0JR01_9ACTN|nr:hypothetical protein [Micromonospora ureilytica]MBG6069470.1 hypothetical protein [Micromonospora ureilytica]
MTSYMQRPLGELLVRVSDSVTVEPGTSYETAGIYSYGRGLFKRGGLDGASISYTRLFKIRSGQLVFSRLFAWEGAIAVVTDEFDGLLVSPEFPVYEIREDLVHPAYMSQICTWPALHDSLRDKASGMGNRRQRVNVDQFERATIPVPSRDDQMRIIERLGVVRDVCERIDEVARRSQALRVSFLSAAFSGKL